MAAKGGQQPQPKWLIDTHGMREALTTSSNSVRVAVIEAIENGEMLILKRVSEELSGLYPELWEDFKDIRKGRYVQITIAAINAASTSAETYGAPLIGSIPGKEHFQAVACACMKKCTLVTAGKAYENAKTILKKCKLSPDAAVSVSDWASKG